MTYLLSHGKILSLHQWRHCALYHSGWKKQRRQRTCEQYWYTPFWFILLTHIHWPWQHSVSVIFVHGLLQNLTIKRLWEPETMRKKKHTHIHTKYNAYYLKEIMNSSYHDCVCSNHYIWSLQMFLKGMNTHLSDQQDITRRFFFLQSKKIKLSSQRASSWPPPGPSVWPSQQHTHKAFWKAPYQEFLWTRMVPPQIVTPDI